MKFMDRWLDPPEGGLMNFVRCPRCGFEHDVLAERPSFRRPDAYRAVPTRERKQRTLKRKNRCEVWSADGSDHRYFVRAEVPFRVHCVSDRWSWFFWFELQKESYEMVLAFLTDPKQELPPGLGGTVANNLVGYANSKSVTAVLEFTGRRTLPLAHLLSPADHRLVVEQEEGVSGVSPERAMEWLVSACHRRRGRRTVAPIATADVS